MAKFLLDTNVLSEPTKNNPNPYVVAWLEANGSRCVIPATAIMELYYGISRLPAGRRRNLIETKAASILSAFPDEVLGYGPAEAIAQAEIRRNQELNGITTSAEDQQIAAIAKTNGLTVATRNVDDYAFSGVRVVNPWEPLLS